MAAPRSETQSESLLAGLTKSSQVFTDIRSNSGFSLIEVILVVLVTGIICATGVSIYAGVTGDSQQRIREDEISSFLYACRHQALMRKSPVTIRYQMSTLLIEQSSTLRLNVPDMDKKFAEQWFEGLTVDASGRFIKGGKHMRQLKVPYRISGNRIMTIEVEL